VAPFRKLSSSGAVAVKSCFAVASIYNIITSLPHDTMQARYMLWPCVHPCMSVTSRRSTKTATHKITQTKPHDSSRDSSFFMPKISAKFDRGHPLRRRQMQTGWVKIGDFRQMAGYISKTVPNRRMVSIKVE